MTDHGAQLFDRAAALRNAFDRSFAEPLPADPPSVENLLAIRVGSEPYALRLSEVAGLFADRKITPIPGAVSGLLGLVGFRGAIAPVYDLHALVGHRSAEATRWLVMAADAPVAFAFAAPDGQLSLRPDAIFAQQSDAGSRRYVREFARTAGLVYPIVDLAAVLDAIKRQAAATANADIGSGER